MVRKMDDIRLSREIEGIMDIRDETDRTGLRIVIDVKKDADPNVILNYFYKNTDLQIYYSYNMVSIVNKRPVQMGLIGMLDAFIAQDVYKRQVLCTPVSAEETDPEGCSVEHPELCIEPAGCTAPDCMFG